MNEVANFQESMEIIDNKKVNESLCNLEEKCDNNQAIRLLNKIDSQLTNHDIDLAYDNSTKKYRFIVGKEGVPKVLNIPLRSEKIEEVGSILISLLNSNDIYIGGDAFGREIKKDDFWTIGSLDPKIIAYTDKLFSKKEKEEFFKFTMDIKNIPVEDWDIDGPMIAGNQTQEYYDIFGKTNETLNNEVTQALHLSNLEPSNFKPIDATEYTVQKNDTLHTIIDTLGNELGLSPKNIKIIQQYIKEYSHIKAGETIHLSVYQNNINLLVGTRSFPIPIQNALALK